jgi:hypothetical protein
VSCDARYVGAQGIALKQRDRHQISRAFHVSDIGSENILCSARSPAFAVSAKPFGEKLCSSAQKICARLAPMRGAHALNREIATIQIFGITPSGNESGE